MPVKIRVVLPTRTTGPAVDVTIKATKDGAPTIIVSSRPRKEALEEHRMSERRMMIAGAVTFGILLVSALPLWWYFETRSEGVTTNTSIEEDDARRVPEPVLLEEQTKVTEPMVTSPVPTSAPKPTPVLKNEPSVPVVPAASASSTPTTPPTPQADPTNCRFVNNNRPMVEEKYVLTCREGKFVATGTYVPGGLFVFSDFAPYTP